VTQWIENATGGRSWNPMTITRSWLAVVITPREFFRTEVMPADQAPGLLFAVAVVLLEEATRFALVDGVAPVFGGMPALSALLALGVASMLVAPAVLHLVAALQTLILIPFAPERGGISETVQVIGYATAPAIFAGIPIPEVRALVTVYGAILLTLGIAIRHQVSFARAALLAAIPNAIVFGWGFRGFVAVQTLLAQWYII
jgi:hypothetical protein